MTMHAEKREEAAPQQIGRVSASESVVAGLVGICLSSIPVWVIAQKHSLEMAVGLGMIFVPLLGLIGWASGGVGQLLKAIASILYVFGVATIGNATDSRLAQKILLPGSEPDLQESVRETEKLLEKMEAAESVEELDEIMQRVEQRATFHKRRKTVWIVCGIAAAALTAMCLADLQLLNNNRRSFILPASFKGVQMDNLLLVLPLSFILLAVPMSVIFASYSKRYLVLSTMFSAYAGTAFYFLFHANLPDLQLWVPPLVCYLFTSGAGLLAEWVSVDEPSEDTAAFEKN